MTTFSITTLDKTINKMRRSEYWQSVVMLNVVMLSVANDAFMLSLVMLNATNDALMLNVVMLSVVSLPRLLKY
jgi:hypothetical protein